MEIASFAGAGATDRGATAPDPGDTDAEDTDFPLPRAVATPDTIVSVAGASTPAGLQTARLPTRAEFSWHVA
jgi:hypothetical protein